MGTILCGADGSADAQHAVDYTARLAQQLGAEVVLVHAIGLLEHMPIDAAHPGVTTGDQARELLRSDQPTSPGWASRPGGHANYLWGISGSP
jgi:nucleotide-binding universal stress UspA family protein